MWASGGLVYWKGKITHAPKVAQPAIVLLLASWSTGLMSLPHSISPFVPPSLPPSLPPSPPISVS